MTLRGLDIDIATHGGKTRPQYATIVCSCGFTVSEMKNAMELLESAGLGNTMIADSDSDDVEVLELVTIDRHEMIKLRR